MNIYGLGLITNTLLGASIGYVTNYFAVKMLFHKYWLFGGMIVEKREQFSENMSELVERDIINNHTIESEINRFEFQRVLYEMMSSLIKVHVYNNTPDVEWNKIQGMPDSIANFFDFYQENMDSLSEKFFISLFTAIKWEDVIAERQRLMLATKIYEIGIKELNSHSTLEAIITALYKENADRQLEQIFPPLIFETLANNATVSLAHLHEKLPRDFGVQLDQTINSMYAHLQANSLLRAFDQMVKEKTLLDILGSENTLSISNELLARAIKLLKSAEGKKIIDNFSDEIFKIMKSIDLPILEILDVGIRTQFESYLRKSLPEMVEKVIRWIQKNKQEIDELINRSVDDVLSDESSGLFDLRGKAKRLLKGFLYENVACEFEVVKTIIDYVEHETDTQAMSVELTNMLLDYLHRNSIAQIVTDLESKNILIPSYFSSLIRNNLDTQLKNLDLSRFDPLFQNKVGSVVTFDFSQHFEGFVKTALAEELKTKFLFSPKGTSWVQCEIREKFASLAEEKLGAAINEDSFAAIARKGNQSLLQQLIKHKETLTQKLATGIHEQAKGKLVIDVLGKEIAQQAGKQATEKLRLYLKEQIEAGKSLSVKALYDHLNSFKDNVKNLTGLAMDLIHRHLHVLLEGRIKQTVKSNLVKLPDRELQKMVEDFMGRELRPINRFGAILGGVTGLVYYLTKESLRNEVMWPHPLGIELLISMIVFSAVGWFTNVVALKMIFKPYQQVRLAGIAIPFTPGVVAKQKPQFAASMGEFVGTKLLQSEAAKTIFQEKRPLLETRLKENFSNDDFKLIRTLLTENSEAITGQLLGFAKNFLINRREAVAERLTDELQESKLSNLNLDALRSDIVDQSDLYLKKSTPLLIKEFENALRSPKLLGEWLPDSVRETLFDSVDDMIAKKLRTLSELIQDDRQLDRLLQQFTQPFENFSQKTLKQVLTDQQSAQLTNSVSNYFIDMANSPAARNSLVLWLNEAFCREISPVRVLHQNVDYVIQSIIGVARERLQENRPDLKSQVYGLFKRSSGMLEDLADSVLDIESTLYHIVDDLVDDKLPAFLERKNDELNEILVYFIDEKIAKTRVANFGIEINSNGVEKIVNRILDNKKTLPVLSSVADRLVRGVLDVPIKDLLKMAAVKTVFDVHKIFAPDIRQLRNELATALETHQPILTKEVGLLMRSIIERYLLRLPVSALFAGLGQADIAHLVRQLVDLIGNGTAFSEHLNAYLKTIASEIRSKNLAEMLDLELLQADLAATIEKLLRDKIAQKRLETTVGEMVDVVIGNIHSIVSADTRQFVLHIGVLSILDAFGQHFEKMINAVNISQVTEREINNMNPKEIEDLFNSFAKDYFRKIELYGLLGGVGGVVGLPAERLFMFIMGRG